MNWSDPISKHFPRLSKPQQSALKKLQVETIRDLLYHLPFRYAELFVPTKIGALVEKDKVAIFGTIEKIETGKTFRGRRPIARATISDETGKIKVTWFHQPYLAKMFSRGDLVRIEGQASEKKSDNFFTFLNPQIEKIIEIPDTAIGQIFASSRNDSEKDAIGLHPIYAESRGITSNWFYHAIQKIFRSKIIDSIQDPIPAKILKKYNLPNLRTALIWIHTPKKEDDALAARKRFAFEEIFFIQLQRQGQRAQISDLKSYKITTDNAEIAKFINNFEFKMTTSQEKAIEDIIADMRGENRQSEARDDSSARSATSASDDASARNSASPMSRLLEGDVGSGKTAVAATAVYTVTKTAPPDHAHGALQTAYMVPTEILAKQHFENFISFFARNPVGRGVEVALITGSACYKFPSKVSPNETTKISRTQLLKWVEEGKIPVLVGTHALISEKVKFKNLGLVIIDEQHRFGTAQRRRLAQKDGFAPHLLSMTATPIPRTLALTIYGDLDLTLLDEMPHGRKPVITEIVSADKDARARVYEKIRDEITAGRQAYVICPRIDEPDPTKIAAIQAKSVKAESERLRREIFPDFSIDEMHSKMKPAEKDAIMKKFESGETDILVSTSVVEVGVNVPNATMIVIEGAERFGLAQLHQLRGRVIRSNHQAYCFVFADSQGSGAVQRLRALKTAKNGFELAELDLKIRGAGELTGLRQWGISDVGMEAIKNLKMVEAARTEAAALVATDPTLKKSPALAAIVAGIETIHFE